MHEVMPVPRRREAASPRPGVELTPTCWLSETDLGMREWAEQGRRLGVIGRGVGWWIGDWLRYGNARFGERYTRAMRITGYDVQTLMNMVYVASRYEPEERREGLSWSHHAEVAARDREERARLLDLAESERLSVRCLRDEVRRARRVEKRAELEHGAERSADHGSEVQCPECGCRISESRAGAVPAA